MGHDFPLFAVQRTASGQWLVRAPSDDPLMPAVLVVDMIEESEPACGFFHVDHDRDASDLGLRIVTRTDWSCDPWRAWYGSGRWKRRRHRQLKDHPLCVLCLGRGIVTVATVADHIEPHRGDWNQFLTGKLQSLCVECHDGSKDRGYALDVGIDGWPLDPRHPCYRSGR